MEKEISIKSTTGLHASLAAKVVQTASKYAVEIELVNPRSNEFSCTLRRKRQNYRKRF
jgi:phosphotransferase system HPr-like phosphotransfer protein